MSRPKYGKWKAWKISVLMAAAMCGQAYGGSYGPCSNEHECFCIGDKVVICSSGEIWDPAPGECSITCGGGTDPGYNAYRNPTQGGNTGTTFSLGDPVNMGAGEYYFQVPFLDLGGPLSLTFSLYYGSNNINRIEDPHDFSDLPFSGNHGRRLVRAAGNGNQAVVSLGMGREIHFRRSGNAWKAEAAHGVSYGLSETDANYRFADPNTHLVYTYKKDAEGNGTLIRVEDRNGNALTYTDKDSGYTVADGLGREITVTMTQSGGKPVVASVSDVYGRAFTFTYEQNPSDNPGKTTLRSITDPLGRSVSFQYAGSHRIAGKTLPDGKTPFTQTYDDQQFSVKIFDQ